MRFSSQEIETGIASLGVKFDGVTNFNNSKILDSIILYTSDGRNLEDLNTYSLDKISTKDNLSSIFHTAFIRRDLISKYKIDEYIKINRSITNNIITSLNDYLKIKQLFLKIECQ